MEEQQEKANFAPETLKSYATMKKAILLLSALMLLTTAQNVVKAQDLTLSDVQNSGCLRDSEYGRRRANETEERRTMILLKEGNILTVQLFNFEATCETEDFIITPKVNNGDPCFVSINVDYIDSDADCICPYNISFTLHDLEPNCFFFSCWWYNGLVNLTEGEPLVLEDIKEDISIDGTIYTLDKVAHTAKLIRKEAGESEVNIPSELNYEGQKYTVTGIGSYVFHSNAALTSITIPGSITYIGEAAFYDCSNLREVCCQADDVPGTGSWVFDNTPIASATLHVPAGSIEKYKTTSPWSGFGNIVALPIEINEATFPDENFRNWVLSKDYGEDGVLTEEEISDVTSIDVMYKGIQSLKGIEFFTSLTDLNCYTNQLTALDLSNNTALTTLYCTTNQLTTLDVSKCINLTHLECNGNQLTELDVSNNTALNELHCSGNKLTELDVSKNIELTNLNCHENQLTELDVSKNSTLKRIWCSENLLTSLDVSGCALLESLKCIRNRLTMLKVSGCPELWEIFCHNNQIKGEAMDEFIDGLPVIPEGWGHLCIVNTENEQNVMTKAQVAAAKAKGWNPRYRFGAFGTPEYADYEGSDEPVIFTAGQMATIILPAAPDASKGKYYRLDRAEAGQIIFEQELQPRAHVPYIIVPDEDFSIDINALDLQGCYRDTVSVDDVSFIGSFVSEAFDYQDGFYIDIIDTTPDCRFDESCVIGALRAYLLVRWDDPYNQGGTKVPPLEKLEVVLRDYGTSIGEIKNEQLKIKNDVFDLSGRKIVNGQLQRGIYIENGQKKIAK